MKRRTVVYLLLALGPAAPALAILGIGDIVYDPTNYQEAVQQFLQLQQQYAQLVQTYQMVRSQYDQMIWMAREVPVNMAARYRALATPWSPSSATNTYGTTGAWITGINTGLGVSGGYAGATQPLAAYGSAFGNIPADQQGRVKTSYGTVELEDGANFSAMQTIGQMRGNAPAVEQTIQNLEADSLSSDPSMNTEIAVLNKINAANIISVRNTQDSNKLLVSLAEERIIAAKRERDAEAASIAEHALFMAQGRAVMAAQAAGASAEMQAWRMP
jgi:hypothetical protein